MNIEKAIEINNDQHNYFYKHANPDIKDAIKLGIEALKGYREGRTKPGGMFFHHLPGETEGVTDETR